MAPPAPKGDFDNLDDHPGPVDAGPVDPGRADSGSDGSELQTFAAQLSFALDPFQVRSCEALEDGSGVLVCAPTGAGKTVVGEFAVHLALRGGGKCFYTTPIKALSNQKFAELAERYGAESVGLLTGDQNIRSEASVVVMTTEVLRNMLYASSPTLSGLTHVVMDEVHYLADRFRGAVWEEVILHLPAQVRLVSLSATVSNAEEFGAWMAEVRGDTTVVVDDHRPIPLFQHVMVGRRLFDLFEAGAGERGRQVVVDRELARHVKQRESVDRWEQPRGRRGGRPGGGFRPLPRPQVLARLDEEGLLPAITFIFSRAGCDGALAQCLRSGLRLTTDDQVTRIREIVHKHTADLPRGDLDVLGFADWSAALERGLAAHHAGMLPVFRHTVEELFVKGLVRAVFATETLALGINMPARTVVLERLVKYNGETHADLTPGEYTQLTGRAGRRGIDVEGHAVVLWQPGVAPTEVAGLASTRTYPLRSSFRPGYNMSINLVDQLGREASRALLERSFAQFQADRSVVGLARTIERNTEGVDGYRERMECHLGDFREYAGLRDQIRERERTLERTTRAARRQEATDALIGLHRGDVIAVPAGRRSGLAVVLEVDTDPADPRPLVLTEDRWAGRLSAADFPSPAAALGRMRLPRHVDHRVARIRRDLASALRETGIRAPGKRAVRGKSKAGSDRELAELRRGLKHHPCHECPEREQHARWAERYFRLVRETEVLKQRSAATTNSLARTFDRILTLLAERGYVVAGQTDGVTEEGRRLGRIYCEADLLVAECLRRGVWTGLDPAELAAAVSCVVYESRRDGGASPRGATGALRGAMAATARLWTDLRDDEQRHKLPVSREPDAGFVGSVYRWAQQEPLVDALLAGGDGAHPLSAGDFVRWCRQVIDLLDQVHVAAPQRELRSTASHAIVAIRRGVVAIDPV